MERLLATTAIVTGALFFAAASANAAVSLGPDAATEGLVYTLTASGTANPLTEHFSLLISGENTASDTRGGRTGINAIALNQPTNGGVVSGVLTAPPGFNFVLGGLNSAGCDGSGNFFCFDNASIPPTPATLLSGDITMTFDVTLGAGGSWAGYTTAFKIDWVGTQNNYSLVSEPIPVNTGGTPPPPPPPAPEPASLTLLGVGLLGTAAFAARRRRRS
jgi:hypothetical protein